MIEIENIVLASPNGTNYVYAKISKMPVTATLSPFLSTPIALRRQPYPINPELLKRVLATDDRRSERQRNKHDVHDPDTFRTALSPTSTNG